MRHFACVWFVVVVVVVVVVIDIRIAVVVVVVVGGVASVAQRFKRKAISIFKCS